MWEGRDHVTDVWPRHDANASLRPPCCLLFVGMARSRATLVYAMHMARTNLDIDDNACAEIMRRYGLRTKREAVNLALRTLASEPLGLEEARRLRGSGWQGDLDVLRASRPA